MPNTKKATTRRTLSTCPKPWEMAFSRLFLSRSRSQEAASDPGDRLSDTSLARHAHWMGPWEVEKLHDGTGWLHVVTRRAEPARDGGGGRLACRHRQDALLGAATFAALAAPNHLSVNGEKLRNRLGHPLHNGARHLGHLSPAAAEVQDATDPQLMPYIGILCRSTTSSSRPPYSSSRSGWHVG